MRQQAIVSLVVGVVLGCLAGAMIQARQSAGSAEKTYNLSVNQRTGRPQLHVKGKPELE